jgi:GNAT superfamily N-acetyltransferase
MNIEYKTYNCYLDIPDSIKGKLKRLHLKRGVIHHHARVYNPPTIVAIEAEKVLGWAIAVPGIIEVYVQTRHRRRGIGTSLYRQAIKAYRADRSIKVVAHNKVSRDFYSKVVKENNVTIAEYL